MYPIEDYYKYLLHQKKYSVLTVDAYRNDIHSFHTFLKHHYDAIPLEEVTDFIIRSWFSDMIDQGMKPSSIKRKKAALTSMYRYLMKQGIIQKNPCRYVSTPKSGKRLPVFVPEIKLRVLFETDIFLLTDYEDLRNRMILETLYVTGMRVSELTSLTDQSFDISNAICKVLGKRNKERNIPIHPLFIEMINHYTKLRKKTFAEKDVENSFFLTKNGKKLYRRLAYRIVFSYLSSITFMKKKSPHVMRHTFATHMLNEGAEINAIKDILGHASLAATQLYTHNTIDKLKSIYKNSHPQSQKRRKL